jgi:hypothetical protein
MDLYAYSQIDVYDAFAKANNIEIPRLRGYRLMSEETKPIDINSEIKNLELEDARDVIESGFHPSACWRTGIDISRLKYYFNYHYDESDKNIHDEYIPIYDSIRWDRIHGKHRKTLKFWIKKQKKRYIEQYQMFNKYIGRPDVLYIHARIGGANWDYYGGPELEKMEWFLGRVDDAFDCTYCDIYAKVDPSKKEENDQPIGVGNNA